MAVASQSSNNVRQRVILAAGDTLYSLAAKHLGGRDRWRELALYNAIDVFEDLAIGQPITIPSASEVLQIATSLATQLPTPASTVIEKIGTTLDLSNVKQENTGSDFSLISWVL